MTRRSTATTLEGVSATTLWTLHNRGTEAKRSDGVIRDPWAVTLLDTISYDYLKFGKPNQSHGAARGRVRRRRPRLPDGAPEGLGGRAGRGSADQLLAPRPHRRCWPNPLGTQSICRRSWSCRTQLLPRDDRIVELAQSALDRSWMDRVDATNGVFITAEGLLMYLEPEDALGLIADCAARFPGGQMMFDSIPRVVQRAHAEGLEAVDALPRAADAVRPVRRRRPGARGHHPRRAVGPRRRPAAGPGTVAARVGARRWTASAPLRRNRPSITLLEFG